MKINIKVILVLLLGSIMAFTFIGYSQKQSTEIQKPEAEVIVAETVFPSYMRYSEVQDICQAADYIILGQVSKVYEPEVINLITTPKGQEIGFVYTVSDVMVEQVFKGDCKPGDIVQVKRMGGHYNNKDYYDEEIEMLDKSMRGFFFLSTDSDYPADMLSPDQGFVKIVDGKIYPDKTNGETYSEDWESAGWLPKPLFSPGQSEADMTNLILQNIQYDRERFQSSRFLS